jgi:hypothetical protein
MEKERDEARREAERRQDFIEHVLRGNRLAYAEPLSWPRTAEGAGPQPKDAFSTCPRCGARFSVPVVGCAGCGYPNVAAAPPSADAPRCGEPEHLRYLEALLAAKNKWLKGLPTREEFEGLHQEVRFLREKCGADIAALDAKVVKLEAASITCDALHRNAGTWNTQHDTQIAALRELALALASERQDEWVQEAARKVRAS